jgi:GNAT superfamily N-acetyltransferase
LQTSSSLRAFAEDPAAWGEDFPPDSVWRRILTDRWCLLLGPVPSSTQVSRLRLDPDEIAEAIHELRAEIAAQGHTNAHWNVGSSSSPGDLIDRLVAHGLEPEDHLTALVLAVEPPEVPGVEARRIRDLGEYAAASAITHDVFGTSPDRRAEWDSIAHEHYEAERRGTGPRQYIAYLDGRVVGAASAVVEDGLPASIMIGGAVVPDARGRGVYRALVRARWDDSLAAGIAALCVQARVTSRPILESIGFERTSEVEVLLDPVTC